MEHGNVYLFTYLFLNYEQGQPNSHVNEVIITVQTPPSTKDWTPSFTPACGVRATDRVPSVVSSLCGRLESHFIQLISVRLNINLERPDGRTVQPRL